MALLAEEIVEEWLNRDGYFTIRGAKLGVREIDLLGIRHLKETDFSLRHIEVQASINPNNYFTPLTKRLQKELGKSPTSIVKRTQSQMNECIEEWIQKKFEHPKKRKLRQRLFPGNWTRELVVHVVYDESELDFFGQSGVTVRRLNEVISELSTQGDIVPKASGADLIELIRLGFDAARD